MNGSTSILDSLTPVGPTPGMVSAGTAPPSYPMVAPHPAPDGSGAMTNLSDEDYRSFMGGKAPPATKPGSGDTSVLDSLAPVPPTAGMQAAHPSDASTWADLAGQLWGGVKRGIVGMANAPLTLLNAEGNLIQQTIGQPQTQVAGLPAPSVPPAKDTAGRYVERIGEFLPGIAAGGLGEGPAIAGVAKQILPTTVAAIGSQAAEDVAPDALKPAAGTLGALAGGVGGAGIQEAVGAGRRLIGNTAGNLGLGTREVLSGVRATPAQIRAAGQRVGGALGPEGQQMLDQASNTPAAIWGAPAGTLVPGSEPTTAQVAPTPGAVGLEKAHRVATPDPFLQRAAEQNTARVQAIQGIQPTGQPGAVGDLFRQQLAAIDAAGQQTISAARAGAQRATEGLGGAGSPQGYGADIRGALTNANATARGQESALWQAVDREGKLALPLGAVQQTARGLLKEMQPGLGDVASSQETQILNGAANLPDVVPFRDAQRLRSNIGFAERALRATPGNEQSLRRLGIVKSALDDAIAEAADQAAQSDSGVAARIQELGHGQSGIGAGGGEGVATGTEGRTAAVSGEGGAGGVEAGGLGSAAGNSAMAAPQTAQGLEPNFSPEAAAAYAAAREATLQRKQTFGTGAIGRVLQGGKYGEQYAVQEADVPRQILSGTAVEPVRVQQYIKAVGGETQAVANMRDALVNDLRERGIVQQDGTLRLDRFHSWQHQRARTIAMFPDLGDQLNTAAKAQATLDEVTGLHAQAIREYENGVAKNFLHDDPLVAVRRAFASGNPTETFTKLVQQVRGTPDAEAGLRRAVVDHIMERFSSSAPSGAGEENFLKAAQFQTWIRGNRGPLRALFGGQGMQNLEAVAADLRRQSQRATATAGSDTQANRLATEKEGLAGAGKHAAGMGAISLMTLLGERLGEMAGEHGLVGAVALPAIGVAVHALRQAGINTTNALVREAMLHPEVAKLLLERVKTGNLTTVLQRRIGTALQGVMAAEIGQSGKQTQQ